MKSSPSFHPPESPVMTVCDKQIRAVSFQCNDFASQKKRWLVRLRSLNFISIRKKRLLYLLRISYFSRRCTPQIKLMTPASSLNIPLEMQQKLALGRVSLRILFWQRDSSWCVEIERVSLFPRIPNLQSHCGRGDMTRAGERVRQHFVISSRAVKFVMQPVYQTRSAGCLPRCLMSSQFYTSLSLAAHWRRRSHSLLTWGVDSSM